MAHNLPLFFSEHLPPPKLSVHPCSSHQAILSFADQLLQQIET